MGFYWCFALGNEAITETFVPALLAHVSGNFEAEYKHVAISYSQDAPERRRKCIIDQNQCFIW